MLFVLKRIFNAIQQLIVGCRQRVQFIPGIALQSDSFAQIFLFDDLFSSFLDPVNRSKCSFGHQIASDQRNSYQQRQREEHTRAVENAYFIQERELGYADKPIAQILKEFCSYTDGATMSAKKDSLANIGGWLAVNDQGLFEEACNLVVVYEGLQTYGGMAGRDMEVLAIGIKESVQDSYMHSRIGQVRYLGEMLIDWGIPVTRPIGGHAVFRSEERRVGKECKSRW